jgi:hypothetical protein
MNLICLSGCVAALPTLEFLYQKGHRLTLLCPTEPAGKAGCEGVSVLEQWSARKDIPCWRVGQNELEKDLRELIRETATDLVMLFGFPYTLNPMYLEQVRFGGWNVHFSLRPTMLTDESIEGCIVLHEWRCKSLGEQVLQQHCVTIPPTEEPIETLSRIAAFLVEQAFIEMSSLQSDLHRNRHLRPGVAGIF